MQEKKDWSGKSRAAAQLQNPQEAHCSPDHFPKGRVMDFQEFLSAHL